MAFQGSICSFLLNIAEVVNILVTLPICIQSLFIVVILFVDNQENDDFTECSQALFTDFYDQQNDEKENQSFPNSSQSILEKSIPKKRQFTESRNSCNVVSNNSSDTSIEEILDSDEDEHIERKKKCYLKNENKMNNEVSIEKKSEHVCCAAKKYFNALFSNGKYTR